MAKIKISKYNNLFCGLSAGPVPGQSADSEHKPGSDPNIPKKQGVYGDFLYGADMYRSFDNEYCMNSVSCSNYN